jgi:hypothetical protein
MFNELKIATYAVVGGTFAYFGIPQEAYWVLAALILLDTFTGAIRALIVDARSFTSAALRNGALAKLLLLLIPVLLALLSKAVPAPADSLVLSSVNGTIAVIALSEAYSILSNIGNILGKNGGSEMDGISFIISKLLALIKSVLDSVSKR